MASNLPAIQFYVGDWKKDPQLQACSIAARGLWFEMLLMMHESPIRGYLMLTEDIAMNDEHIARIGGVDQALVTHLIEELQLNGVFDYTSLELETGHRVNVICSRRMVRDESKRQKCSAAGLRGVKNNPLAQGTYKGSSIGEKGSSYSTSNSTSFSEEEISRFRKVPGVDEVWRSVPRRVQIKPKTTQIWIGKALDSIGSENEQPIEFLKHKVESYYTSPEGSGEYHRSLIRFLEEEGWKEPEEAWSAREKPRRQL